MKVILHAPTSASLARSRAEAPSIATPDDTVRIIASGEGAVAASETRDADTDHMLVVCQSSLADRGSEVPAGIESVPMATSLIARLQRKGWVYLRL